MKKALIALDICRVILWASVCVLLVMDLLEKRKEA